MNKDPEDPRLGWIVIVRTYTTPIRNMASTVENEASHDIDPIWTTSRTARQIYALGEVEKVDWGHIMLHMHLCVSNVQTMIGHHTPALFGSIVYFPADVASNGWAG